MLRMYDYTTVLWTTAGAHSRRGDVMTTDGTGSHQGVLKPSSRVYVESLLLFSRSPVLCHALLVDQPRKFYRLHDGVVF